MRARLGGWAGAVRHRQQLVAWLAGRAGAGKAHGAGTGRAPTDRKKKDAGGGGGEGGGGGRGRLSQVQPLQRLHHRWRTCKQARSRHWGLVIEDSLNLTVDASEGSFLVTPVNVWFTCHTTPQTPHQASLVQREP